MDESNIPRPVLDLEAGVGSVNDRNVVFEHEVRSWNVVIKACWSATIATA